MAGRYDTRRCSGWRYDGRCGHSAVRWEAGSGRYGCSDIAAGISWQMLFVDFFAHCGSFRQMVSGANGGKIRAQSVHKKTPQIAGFRFEKK